MNITTTNKIEIKKRLHSIAKYILDQQLDNGAIPWFKGDKLDPWDHSEAIMALTITGEYQAAEKGFSWLEKNQTAEGYWFAKYLGDINDGDLDRFKIETNFVAYPATALWHYYLATRDKALVQRYFPMITKAINFVVSHQNEQGDIQWALSKKEPLPKDALVTACASILRSIECAISTAELLEQKTLKWRRAHLKLGDALKTKPWRFDRSWESKARFSMDWFYPILSGVFTQNESKLRLQQGWEKFVVNNYGCKCVADQPWVTVAESCELIIALIAANQRDKAITIYEQLLRWQDSDGGFWTGYVYRDNCIWPEEKTTWTAAAVALASDALFEHSDAAKLFTSTSELFFSQNA